MKANFSNYWHFLLLIVLPFIAQAQKEHRYLVFEEKEGKINEKPIEEVFFNEKGDFVKAFAFREKDTFPIGKSYSCLNKGCIKARYEGKKIKEKKNTISVIELEQCHSTKTEITYFFEDEKLIKKVVKEFPFLRNQTVYFYDNRQRITLIVGSLGSKMVIQTTQIEYKQDISPDNIKDTIFEKITSFYDGKISEKKLIYIEQN